MKCQLLLVALISAAVLAKPFGDYAIDPDCVEDDLPPLEPDSFKPGLSEPELFRFEFEVGNNDNDADCEEEATPAPKVETTAAPSDDCIEELTDAPPPPPKIIVTQPPPDDECVDELTTEKPVTMPPTQEPTKKMATEPGCVDTAEPTQLAKIVVTHAPPPQATDPPGDNCVTGGADYVEQTAVLDFVMEKADSMPHEYYGEAEVEPIEECEE